MLPISIVTVTYNNVDGLRRTSESILAQKSQNFEWIIVDGGSQDGTVEFLGGLKGSNIRWDSGRDGGIYNAMNKGAQRTAGEYIIFLNAGDLLADDNVIESTEKLIEQHKPSLAYGHAVERDDVSDHYKRARRPAHNIYAMFTHHQAIFYRKSIFVKYWYDESFKFGADWVLTEIIRKNHGSEFLNLDFPVCVFERGGISQRDDHRKCIDLEHWRIYREVVKIPLPVAGMLWVLKTQVNKFRKLAPGLYDSLRYGKKRRNA